jgi:hypothetical protein
MMIPPLLWDLPPAFYLILWQNALLGKKNFIAYSVD